MARTPAAPAADTDPDPDQDQDQDQDDDQDQGYVIEIHVHADGTFTVEREDEDEDEDEEDDDAQAGAAGETAPGASDEGEEYTDIADALKAALKIYREHPVSGSDEAHFAAGYRAEGGPSTGPGGATRGT